MITSPEVKEPNNDTQIEIQNEDETSEIENTNRQHTTTVHEIYQQQNTDEQGIQDKVEVINIDTMNADKNVRKEQVLQGYIGGNLPVTSPPDYWVQFNMDGGRHIQGGGAPMYYEPDRNLFVRLVFAIVLFMLILTAGFVGFVYLTNVRRLFIQYGMILLIIGVVGMLGLNYAMMCIPLTRVPPCNYICLFMAVSFMSLIAACVTTRYRTEIILLALLATIATVAVCLCLACTRFDFTQFLLYIVVIAAAFCALVLIVSITMMITGIRYKPLTLVILVVGTLINVVVLIMELQMILGGRTVELSEDDYALGAFMLYTSIVDIFLKLVQILGILDQG